MNSIKSFARCLALALASIHIFGAPQISKMEPLGIVPGARTVLTFSGSGVESASNLWTSFPAEVKRLTSTNDGQVSFSVRCEKDVSGVQAVQLIGPEGASPFQLLLVDHLKGSQRSGAGDSAMKLEPPIAIDANASQERIDFYEFNGKPGDTFSIEAIAHRIGSQMDPVVRVLDATGKELAFCEDEGGVWRDARFRFAPPVEGTYRIAVHDVGFGGGSNYEYRLRVGHDPLVWYTFPLVDPTDAAAAVFERMGDGPATEQPASPANPPSVAIFPSAPQIAEVEPNDDRTKAQMLPGPVLLNGKIRHGHDVDYFRIEAKKDQRLIFRSQTRSLGSPCDLVLRLQTEDGALVKESDLSSAADASVTNKFAEAGTYILELRELSGIGVTNAPYRVKLEEFAPGVTSATENNIVAIKPGESAKVKLNFARFDYDGPIELAMEPAIEGISIENTQVPEKKNELELTLKAKDDLAPGTFALVSFRAKGEGIAPAKVSTRPALKKSFPLMLNSPDILDGIVTVVVRGK